MARSRGEARVLLALVNRHRDTRGLRILALNKKLNRAARIRCARIVARRVLSHEGWVRAFKRSGYYQTSSTVGENIAQGHQSVTSANAAWLNSPSHRANYEKPEFREMGFARVGNVRVQTFGAR